MADIINFADHRKKERPSIPQLIDEADNFVLADWEKFARNNKLNDFFVSIVGSWARSGINYLNDLNAISVLEQNLGMSVSVRSPGAEHMGWRAALHLKSTTVFTPDMPFETYARCFNILLHIKLKKDLVQNGYLDEL